MNLKQILFTLTLATILGISAVSANEIIIDKPNAMLYVLTENGDTIFAEKCALGRGYGDKKRKGDCKTPEGVFHVHEICKSWNWPYEGKYTHTYGPYFIRLRERRSIGIHGTSRPSSIGKRASHGCIRLTNDNVTRLKELVSPGDKVTILPDVIKSRKTSGTDDDKQKESIKSKVKETIVPEISKTENDSVSNVQNDSIK